MGLVNKLTMMLFVRLMDKGESQEILDQLQSTLQELDQKLDLIDSKGKVKMSMTAFYMFPHLARLYFIEGSCYESNAKANMDIRKYSNLTAFFEKFCQVFL